MKFSNLLTLLVLVLGISMLTILGMAAHPPEAGEPVWKMKIHYGLIDETICAVYTFDTLDSCERTKDWFVGVTSWHGENTYSCVLDSECPKE